MCEQLIPFHIKKFLLNLSAWFSKWQVYNATKSTDNQGIKIKYKRRGFPGGSDSKEFACNMWDPCSSPGSGRSPGEGTGNPLQYSCLGNPMDRGAWRATTHGAQRTGHAACGVSQFPKQGVNQGAQQWQHGVLTTGPPGNSSDVMSCLTRHRSFVIFSAFILAPHSSFPPTMTQISFKSPRFCSCFFLTSLCCIDWVLFSSALASSLLILSCLLLSPSLSFYNSIIIFVSSPICI